MSFLDVQNVRCIVCAESYTMLYELCSNLASKWFVEINELLQSLSPRQIYILLIYVGEYQSESKLSIYCIIEDGSKCKCMAAQYTHQLSSDVSILEICLQITCL